MARTGFSRPSSTGTDKTTDAIKKKAYELYEKRGRRPGHEMEDWLEAERIVKQKSY